ncbi:adenosylcobinamide-GDP ribazoletransferase [Anaeroselena agilis]|uniref:Adenosylcobinamide-GDP ribazoletransferase n=1 Tax=Anaeroselena agilis TaxID=3063788 RepID=A0ABU3NY65_9FIRM|nr:adenosylcobinamide-GDP ribazoletransferase [Selenomonadales bacterium 4137-cl]
MDKFLTALQFLTRIRLVSQDTVAPETFGAAVRYFPLVGAVIGAILAAACRLADHNLPIHTLAAGLILLEIFLTGGLHCDGLMDSADGLMSGRSRERMLEIMKDSRVGAHGVIAFVALILVKWSLLLDLLTASPAPAAPLAALFAMPVLGRLAMVIVITSYPYARPEGIGKAFAVYAGRPALYIAAATAALLVAPLGPAGLAALATAALFAVAFGRYATRALGGLTGDTYGAVAETTEVIVLLIFVLFRNSCFW